MALPVELRTWALRHHVSEDALHELNRLLGSTAGVGQAAGGSEALAQSQVRLDAAAAGMTLFRNNVGVLKNEEGRPVRYGLANDSAGLNKRLKSSDLIGWRKLQITPEMVGSMVAQFAAIECKAPGWRYSGDKHEEAQQRFIALTVTAGGYGRFVTGAGQLG